MGRPTGIHYPFGSAEEPSGERTLVLPRTSKVERNDDSLLAPLKTLPGVGPSATRRLAGIGLLTIQDMLLYLPFRHEPPARVSSVAELRAEEGVTLRVRVGASSVRRSQRRNLRILEALVADDSGSVLAVWYNQEYLARSFQNHPEVLARGRLSTRGGVPRFVVHTHEILSEDGKNGLHVLGLVPVYPGTADVSVRLIRKTVHEALPRAAAFIDPLPARLLAERRYPDKATAVACYHFPRSMGEAAQARERLVFEELLLLQLVLLRKRDRQKERPAVSLGRPAALAGGFLSSLPFLPTRAQERVISEIENDLACATPMLRLLQGDVGSGKTLVAVYTMLRGVESGGQAVLMAPTEVLVDQHADRLRTALGPLGLEIAVLKGSLRETEKRALRRRIQAEDVQMIVGTHALIQETVSIPALRVAVVDEQHRFGVKQRDALLAGDARGCWPHVLHMTATPIPRTLSLTLYGDLDISVIDELPPGREPVATRLFYPEQEQKAWKYVRARLDRGEQAYVVCPLIEESAAIEAASVVSAFNELTTGALAGYSVRLLHGRMPSAEKREAMAAFTSGEAQVLISTTVIEVGVDVPNASVMVILGAKRFGISQLHQLRGRIGRGCVRSVCLLMADRDDEEGLERLALFARTCDGFRLAEADLAIRGEGQLFGERQTGFGDLRLARLIQDHAVLEAARAFAVRVLAADPELQSPAHVVLAEAATRRFGGLIEWLDKA